MRPFSRLRCRVHLSFTPKTQRLSHGSEPLCCPRGFHSVTYWWPEHAGALWVREIPWLTSPPPTMAGEATLGPQAHTVGGKFSKIQILLESSDFIKGRKKKKRNAAPVVSLGLISSLLEEVSAKYSSLENQIVCFFVLSNKKDVPGTSGQCSQPRTHLHRCASTASPRPACWRASRELCGVGTNSLLLRQEQSEVRQVCTRWVAQRERQLTACRS